MRKKCPATNMRIGAGARDVCVYVKSISTPDQKILCLSSSTKNETSRIATNNLLLRAKEFT
jgi:hypothetical protein